MPSRKLILEENNIYHIFNRGFDKQTIFFEDRDYRKFVDNLRRYNDEFEWIKIYAWSIMPNHFHLVLSSFKSGLEISDFMRKVQQSYAMHFKTKYKSISPDLNIVQIPQLFEWRFKAKLLDSEEYLQQAMLYVALNPIKHWIVDKIEDWDYTSYHQMEDSWINLDESLFDDWD